MYVRCNAADYPGGRANRVEWDVEEVSVRLSLDAGRVIRRRLLQHHHWRANRELREDERLMERNV
jgi:hypothetical protein